jgi:hypothetical protein
VLSNHFCTQKIWKDFSIYIWQSSGVERNSVFVFSLFIQSEFFYSNEPLYNSLKVLERAKLEHYTIRKGHPLLALAIHNKLQEIAHRTISKNNNFPPFNLFSNQNEMNFHAWHNWTFCIFKMNYPTIRWFFSETKWNTDAFILNFWAYGLRNQRKTQVTWTEGNLVSTIHHEEVQ